LTRRIARTAACFAAAAIAIAILHLLGVDVEGWLIAFGWAGGKELVAASYGEAKARAPKRKRHRGSG
jgi:hypothetical protein